MHVHIVLCCGAKMVLFTNKLSEHSFHIYLFTKFHTSKHLGKRVTQTCMFTLFFCCGVKTVLFTNKLSEHSCHIINPYVFTVSYIKQVRELDKQSCMCTLQSRSCQLPFCTSPIFHSLKLEIFPFTCLLTFCGQQCDS